MNNIKVLVVDDSVLMRRIISDMINETQGMEVIDTAKNGEELIAKLNNITPDVITLDVEMPKMDGIEVLKKLREKDLNTTVLMLSSLSKKGAEITMNCLELGAFDFISKPSGHISLDITTLKDELIEKIRTAGEKNKNLNLGETGSVRRKGIIRNRRISNDYGAVVIGASTGGPKAIHSIITALPGDIGAPVFVVQHMPEGFTKAFAERLNSNSKLQVVEASHNEEIEKNKVYVAPGGYHMEVDENNRIILNRNPTIWGVRPAVDKLFISASKIYNKKLISIVLTGMGKDGAQGTEAVKAEGGYTISEDKSTCTIYGMPKAAYETGSVDEVLPLHYIPDRLLALLQK
ncbi:protein-glutamate methylesterase/protein-glutamine glutaminase [Clostridium polynesiense]|uniref:protein-glutamate methylesterase/protein-glutamine glutaminase n=1 Tax=Clostridium polynesiense TaxID=1325933 RepID=UPI00058D2F8B|nr:chemotaxis response regulator protein-glutamate methylesterase [Clostridium polynesiense]